MFVFQSSKRYLKDRPPQSALSKGFTLIELVSVIIILAVLAIGVSSFLQFGSQIYSDSTARDQILSSARFALERLNRELRISVPNSARVVTYLGGADNCLEFTPIEASAVYVDIPVFPENPNDQMTIVPASTSIARDDMVNLKAIVYPTASDDVYVKNNRKFYSIVDASYSSDPENTPHSLTLESDVLFAEESTTNRVYFIGDSVMYCIEGSGQEKELVRYKVTSHDSNGQPQNRTDRALMSEYLTADSEFVAQSANLQRNAIISARLHYQRVYEEIVFNHEIQVPNVP